MKKTKMQNGITLVALIVTIVILIILAVVAIVAIDNNDILIRANDATTLFGDAEKNEMNQLVVYGNTIGNYYNDLFGGDNTETGKAIVNGAEVNVGDTIKFDSNGDGTKEDWILLTCTSNLIEIVSKNVMYDSNGKGLELGDSDVEKAKQSFNSAESSMLSFCKKVVTVTSNVRMINSNDISKMRNLDILKSNSTYWISKKLDWWASDGFGHELRIFIYNANGIEQVEVVAGGGDMFDQDNFGWAESGTYGVRPIIKNPAGISYSK